MKRPLGITILGLLFFVNVGFYGVLLLLALFDINALAAFLKALSPGGAGPEMQLKMGRLLPIYYAAAMGGVALVAWGFWRLRKWAWMVVVGIIGLNTFVLLVMETPAAWRVHSGGAIGLWVVRMMLCAFFLWYFSTRKVRTAFRVRAPKESVAHAS